MDIIERRPRGKADYEPRLLEAETAYDLGIPLDNNWYAIPVVTREYMIATRLARQWIEALSTEDSIREANARPR